MMCNQREIKVFSGLPDLSTCMNVQEMLTHGALVSAGSTNSLADRNNEFEGQSRFILHDPLGPSQMMSL